MHLTIICKKAHDAHVSVSVVETKDGADTVLSTEIIGAGCEVMAEISAPKGARVVVAHVPDPQPAPSVAPPSNLPAGGATETAPAADTGQPTPKSKGSKAKAKQP